MFAFLSTVAGERGAAGAERDIRGFALKFYTEECNWDIVGNSPCSSFVTRSASLNSTMRSNATRAPALRSADNSWDFWSLLPEALLQVTIVLFIGKLRARNRVSPDKMLQGRLFSYGDTQCYRLRVNFNHIPVNAPKCPFLSCHRDGAMSTDANLGGTPTYWPNSKGVWTDRDVSLIEPPLPIEGTGHIFAQRIADLTDRLMRRIG